MVEDGGGCEAMKTGDVPVGKSTPSKAPAARGAPERPDTGLASAKGCVGWIVKAEALKAEVSVRRFMVVLPASARCLSAFEADSCSGRAKARPTDSAEKLGWL
jgi:hypothetical protein